MRVSRIAKPLTALGPGTRIGLWVQGCTIGCDGCASKDTWDPRDGSELPASDVARQILDNLGPEITGLTITGGEPFQQPDQLTTMIEALRSDIGFDEIDVLIFTGYAATRARRISPELWALADAIVAGPYVKDRPGDGWLRASGNQTLHLLTPRAERRYRFTSTTQIQVGVQGSDLAMAGLPAPGDLEEFRTRMEARGIAFKEVSWS